MSLLSLWLIARHSHVCPPISLRRERQQKQLPPLIYRIFGYISFFHKLSESLKTACNRVHYRITGLSQHLIELYIYTSVYSIKYRQDLKSSVTTLVIVFRKFRITKKHVRKLFISLSINYHHIRKSSEMPCLSYF